MRDRSNTTQYYLLSFSNFIAALGGGMILGQGVALIDEPFLKEGSVLAFFMGTVLGLLFLQFTPKKISTFLTHFFPFFSGITSLILLTLFIHYAKNGKLTGIAGLVFFCLLSLRFAFWFYSRAKRAVSLANQQQSIAWVEIGYYAGMIVGLLMWTLPGIHMEFNHALIIDACLQFFVGFIDIYTNRIYKLFTETSHTIKTTMKSAFSDDRTKSYWAWRLVISLVFLTVGTQAAIFGLLHQTSAHLSPLIIATFYGGVFIAALVYKKNSITLEWHQSGNKSGHGLLCITINNLKKTIRLSSFCLATAICVLISTCLLEKMVLFLIFTAISAYLYEILALAILDRIGIEEKLVNGSGILIRSYGLMGLGSAVGLWLLTLMQNSFEIYFMLFLCFAVGFGVIRRRHLFNY